MRFKLFGVEIQVSFLFSVVIALMLVMDKTGLALPTFIAAALHELGHMLAMWAAGCQPKKIRLAPACVQIVRGYPRKKYGELAIALCGPAANLSVYLTVRLIYIGCGGEQLLNFALINLLLAAFNMLPVSGLDGGTALRLLLEKSIGLERASCTVKIISYFFGILTLATAIIATACGAFNPTVYIAALYFFLTAWLKR